MTVSRALGGRGRIASETKERVLAFAKKIGYRPDPEVAKLMHHIRVRRRRRFQSVMVGLTTRPPDDCEPYFRALVAGAEAQAVERGYGFEVVHVAPSGKNWSVVSRTLQSRGVDGVLLLPAHAPIDLSGVLEWKNFSVVSASASATGPVAHRVMPHHFANALLLCRILAREGRRRIGLVMSAEHDVRSEHGFTSAVMWHAANEASSAITPLIVREPGGAQVRRWFSRENPDAIITNELSAALDCARSLGRKIGGPVRFVVTSLNGQDHAGISGIDERPGAIGAAAAEMLAGMIERRARGRPGSPNTTLLNGRWVP